MLTERFHTLAKYYNINLNRWWVIGKRLWGILFIGVPCIFIYPFSSH